MTRETAWQILCEFTQPESLRRHALAIENIIDALKPIANQLGLNP